MLHFLKYILFSPLAVLYWIIIQVRYFLYQSGIKKVQEFDIPIISIGNITVGGTGKTPMVHFIAKELKECYPIIAIISRGYGRKSKGFQLVHDGKNLLSIPKIAGDEPFLLANLLGNCIIAVDENRCRAIEKIEDEFNPDLILLDDGFQQLGIKKNVDIILMNASKPFSELRLIPFGFGRETLNELNRASILVFTKTDNFTLPNWHEKLKFQHDIFTSKYDSEIWQYTKMGYQKVNKVPKDFYAFCGIADPNSFKLVLKKHNIKPIGFKAFKDHEPYLDQSMNFLSTKLSSENIKNIITTEKDIVKLPDEFLEKYHIFTIRINHIFAEKEWFIQKIKYEIEGTV
jgi:tetraacyldisaccharide 4'-kinase